MSPEGRPEFDAAAEIAKERPDGEPYQGEDNVTLSDSLAGLYAAIRHLNAAVGQLARDASADVREQVDRDRLLADEWLERPLHFPDAD